MRAFSITYPHWSARHEAHLPAEQHLPQAYSRLPSPDGHQGRPTCIGSSSSPRAKEPRGIDLQEVILSKDQSFSRFSRIRKSAEYRQHRRRSRIFRTNNFLVAWGPPRTDHSRLGITASKKNVGNAPQRNRTKRVLREWFRLHQHELAAPWDLVVIAQHGAPSLTLQMVEKELGDLINWLNRKSERFR